MTIKLSSLAQKLALILVGVLLLTACPSKVEVHRVTARRNGEKQKQMKGVFYALPRTVVRIKVPISRVDKSPGKYEKFARCFFPEEADGRVRGPATDFEIGEEIAFETKGEPDPDQIFMVNTNAGWFQTKSLTMQYTDDGVLGSAKAETKDETVDFTISALKTIASIGASIASHGAIPGGLRALDVRTLKSRPRPPSEIKKLAQQLKERAELRRCYNFYISAAAQRGRLAANELISSIKIINAAQGPINELDETAINNAVTSAQNAVVNNSRAIALASEAIAKAETEEAKANDNSNNRFSTARTERLKQAAEARAEKRSMRAGPPEPLEIEPGKERSALELYEEALKFEAKARDSGKDALKHAIDAKVGLEKKKDEANLAAQQLRNSDTKDVALDSVRAATKAVESAGKVLTEAQQINSPNDSEEFDASFLGGYYDAKALADHIRGLEDQRISLITTPNTDVPKDTLQLMLNELDATIKNLKQQYFLGQKKTQTWSPTIEYVPTKADVEDRGKPSELFAFSDTGGVCASKLMEAQGIKINSDFRIKSKCAETKQVSLTFEKLKNPDGTKTEFASVVDEAEFLEGYGSGRENRGFYYRVPSRARLRISLRSGSDPPDEVKAAVLTIAQLGVIASLPVSAGGRRTSYNLALDTTTGALRNFELGADAAIQKSNLEEAEKAAQSIIEARDPLERMKRRKEFLETIKGVRDAEKALTKPEKDEKEEKESDDSKPSP